MLIGFVICILLTVGITNILVNGSIFKGLRQFLDDHGYFFMSELVNCMMCSGFWVGLFVGMIYALVFGQPLVAIPIIGIIVAFIGSLASDIYSLLRDWLEDVGEE